MSLCDVAFNVLVVLNVHSGFAISLHTAVIVVAHVIVTVVGLAVRLAGIFPLFLTQPLHTYPLLHVALILTHELYLYVHAHATLSTHVHLFNVKTCVLLANHIL